MRQQFKKRIRKSEKAMVLYSALISLFITSILMVPMSYAKYTSQTDGNASVQVGRPVIEIVNTSANDEINDVEQTIQFDVQNFEPNDDTIINQATLFYNLEIVQNKNIDMTYKLYKVGSSLDSGMAILNPIVTMGPLPTALIKRPVGIGSVNVSPDEEVVMTNNQTTDYTMIHTDQQVDSYVLVVTFNKIPNPADVANAVTINLHATQKTPLY